MSVNWARSPYVDYDEVNPKKSVEELIANLAREVVQLKRELGNLKTELTEIKRNLNERKIVKKTTEVIEYE